MTSGIVLIIAGVAILLFEAYNWIIYPKIKAFQTLLELLLDIPLTIYIGIGLICLGVFMIH